MEHSYVTLAIKKNQPRALADRPINVKREPHPKRVNSRKNNIPESARVDLCEQDVQSIFEQRFAVPVDESLRPADEGEIWLSGSISPPSLSTSVAIEDTSHLYLSSDECFERLRAILLRLDAHKTLLLRSVWEYLQSHKTHGGQPPGPVRPVRPSRSWLIAEQSGHANVGNTRPRFSSYVGTLKPNDGAQVSQARAVSSRSIYRTLLSQRHIDTVSLPKSTQAPQLKLGVLPSASFILLQSALPTVLAEVFIRTLRLETALCRERSTVVAQLQHSKRLFSSFSRWRQFVRGKPFRDRHTVATILNHWVRFVEGRRFIRATVNQFVSHIRHRLAAINSILTKRRLLVFRTWHHKARSLRVAGSLLKFAKGHVGGPSSLLRLALQPTRAVVAVSAVLLQEETLRPLRPPESHNSVVPQQYDRPFLAGIASTSALKARASATFPPTHVDYLNMQHAALRDRELNTTAFRGMVQRIVFGHWRDRLQRRRDIREAHVIDRNRLMGLAYRRWRRSLEVVLNLRDAEIIKNRKVQKQHDEPVDDQPTYLVLHVADKSPLTSLLGPYAEKAADEACAASLCNKAMKRWTERHLARVADHTFRNRLVVKALSRWYQRMQTITTHKRVLRLLFGVWRDKLRQYRLRLLADDWRGSHLAKAAFTRWHDAAAADRQYRRHALKASLLWWVEKKQVVQIQKELCRRKASRHLWAWRDYVELKRVQRYHEELSVSISDRVAKHKAVSRWHHRLIALRKDRIFLEVTEEVQRRRLLATVLKRWMAKVLVGNKDVQPHPRTPMGMNESREFL